MSLAVGCTLTVSKLGANANAALGCSNDLSWDGESKRIIAVGAGKELSV